MKHRPPVTDQPEIGRGSQIPPAPPRSAPFVRRLLLIALIGLAARVTIVAYAERRPARFDFPDSHRYMRVARNIAAGRGPIDEAGRLPGRDGPTRVLAGTDPLYPVILSIGARLGVNGADVDTASGGLMRFGRIVNVIVGTAAILMLGLFARILTDDARIGLAAAALYAVDPITVYFTALVLTETVYVLLLLIALWAIAKADRRGGAHLAIIAGGALGLGAAARGSGLFMPVMLIPLIWMRPRADRRGATAWTLAACITVALTLAPTTARNYRLFGEFIPVRTGSGASLLESLGPWADGGPGMDRIVYPSMPPDAGEAERDRISRRAALDWARRHPWRVASLAWAKLRRTWSITPNAPGHQAWYFDAVGWASVAPVFLLAVGGIWGMRGQPRRLALLLAPAVYFTLLHMVFAGSVRYRMPAMPGLFVLAACAAMAALPGGREQASRRAVRFDR